MPLLQDFINAKIHVKIFFHDFISNIYITIRLGNLNIDMHKKFLQKDTAQSKEEEKSHI